MSDVESKVKYFYDEKGWKSKNDETLDAYLWEDLRDVAQDYVSSCRKKVLNYIPNSGAKILDAASGPLQYDEYLLYSENYEKRYCVDISQEALKKAESRLGSKGEYVKASLLDLPFDDNFFDASISLHTIYHIDKDLQEQAVRELIRVTKQNSKVVIIYSNPNSLSKLAYLPIKLLKNLFKKTNKEKELYFYLHNRSWWNRFKDDVEFDIVCWRFLTAYESKKLIPDSQFGKKIFSTVSFLEDRFPHLLSFLGTYIVINMTKK